MSQPIISGEATSAQSEMWVYCSLGARREPLKSLKRTGPTQSMSGSLNAPGREYGKSRFWHSIEPAIDSQTSKTSPVVRQLWPWTRLPHIPGVSSPYSQSEKTISRFWCARAQPISR